MSRVDHWGQSRDPALGWLYDRQKLGIVPGLDRVESLLGAMGRPHAHGHVVHVAGTNGKGSVAGLLVAALEASGHRTGVYTSPHLIRFAERIRVGGEEIPIDDLVRLLDGMRPAIDDLDRAGTPPTFFEICTVAALTHFREVGVDWAVVEAGMGGRQDATNVVQPDLSIITNIGLDHTAFLGEDIAAITSEKAGIVRPGVPVVTAAEDDALNIIRDVCADKGAALSIVGEDYRIEPSQNRARILHGGDERSYRVAMDGSHQLWNAAIVVATCDVLASAGVAIQPGAVREALATVTLPGRLETIEKDDVRVLVDGAHNEPAAATIGRYLAGRGRSFDLIVGFNRDKDWTGMLGHLVPMARRVWGIPVRSPRSLRPEEIGEALPPGIEFTSVASFGDAWEKVVGAGSSDVLVTGSLFVAGEARAVLTGQAIDEVGGYQ